MVINQDAFEVLYGDNSSHNQRFYELKNRGKSLTEIQEQMYHEGFNMIELVELQDKFVLKYVFSFDDRSVLARFDDRDEAIDFGINWVDVNDNKRELIERKS